jgi:tetratricopeptide (TPR) repeat protein
MTLFAFIALFGWIPFVVVLFAIIPARKATAAAIIGAWLLVPPYRLEISALPDFSRSTAAAIGIVLGTILFGGEFILRLRPRWFDLPMLLWCCTGIGSSLQGGLGIYDGLSDALSQVLWWGLPYLAGRIYFSNLDGLRIFTIAMIIGGLIYVLPCLWEMRMSPQLLKQIYGGEHFRIGITARIGGYRPQVFFATGLECGFWMSASALVAWWLYRCGTIKKIGQFRFGPVLLSVLVGTAILCRSTGAALLLACGIFILWASTRLRTRMLLWALVFFFPLYVALRVPQIWSGEQAVNLFQAILSQDRADSLGFRFKCENLLIRKAIQQPVWGWGGWGRSAVYWDESDPHLGHGAVPTDGLWVITLGTKGFLGLSLLYLALELPVMLFLVRFPVRVWSLPQVAPAAVAATLICLYMIDCTVNGFINIIYIAMAGGLISITPAQAGISTVGLYRTGISTEVSDLPERGTAEGRLLTHVINGEELNYVLSRPVVSRIAMTDRYRELGRSLKRERLWADAYSAWQQAFDVLTELAVRYPDHPDLLRRWCDCANDVAWLLLNHPDLDSRGPAYALSLAARVVDRCANSDVYRNTLGAAYLRNGDPAAAITLLEGAAASSESENPFNHVFLAMAYAQLGDREKARHWLAQATFLKERGYQNHHELAGFCDEVHLVLGDNPARTLPVHP